MVTCNVISLMVAADAKRTWLVDSVTNVALDILNSRIAKNAIVILEELLRRYATNIPRNATVRKMFRD